MAQQLINVGTFPNDATGDPAQTAFTKINNNFSQLFGTSQGVTFGPPPTPPGGVAVTINAALGSSGLVINQAGSIAGESIVGQAGAPVSLRLTDGQAGNTIWSVNVGINAAGEFEIINNTAALTPFKIAAAGNITLAAPSAGDTVTVNNFSSANAFTVNYTQTPGAGFAMLVNSSTATGDVRGVQVGNSSMGGTGGCFGFGVANDTNSTFFMGKNNTGSVARFIGAPSGDLAWLFSGGTTPIALVTGTFGAATAQLLISAGSPGNVKVAGPLGINGATPPAQSTGWGTATGASVANNFSGSAATLAQATAAIAELITVLKAFGLLGT